MSKSNPNPMRTMLRLQVATALKAVNWGDRTFQVGDVVRICRITKAWDPSLRRVKDNIHYRIVGMRNNIFELEDDFGNCVNVCRHHLIKVSGELPVVFEEIDDLKFEIPDLNSDEFGSLDELGILEKNSRKKRSRRKVSKKVTKLSVPKF